ncbi:MAG TPA: GlsB/YeaQ/YmgE family stress response membrane protein [Terracidiphilus sp.]|nr:GlsB/YeaQ/YmgE family stress response membrane protein [Terracidiphilus sp.]
MLHWLWIILIGLVVGALAKLIMPGKDPGGFIITILLGIAGSLVATWIGLLVGWYSAGQSAGFIMSLLGAIVLLAIYRLFKRRAVAS